MIPLDIALLITLAVLLGYVCGVAMGKREKPPGRNVTSQVRFRKDYDEIH